MKKSYEIGMSNIKTMTLCFSLKKGRRKARDEDEESHTLIHSLLLLRISSLPSRSLIESSSMSKNGALNESQSQIISWSERTPKIRDLEALQSNLTFM